MFNFVSPMCIQSLFICLISNDEAANQPLVAQIGKSLLIFAIILSANEVNASGLSVTLYTEGGQFAEQSISFKKDRRYLVNQRNLIDRFRHSNCGNLLRHQGQFSLDKMQEIDYITKHQKEGFAQLPPEILLSQVAFIESFSEATTSTNTAIQSTSFFPMSNTAQYQTRATMRMIAGQIVDPKLGLVQKPLTWLLDPDFAGKTIDRTKYLLTWEASRAAQTKIRDIHEVMRRQVTMMWMESYLYKVDPKKALVTLHSLDEAHTRSYQRFYPVLKIIETSNNDPNNTILGATLDKFLEAYPPEQHLQSLFDVMKIGNLKRNQALELLLAPQHIQRVDYDVTLNQATSENFPIIMRPPDRLAIEGILAYLKVRVTDPPRLYHILQYFSQLQYSEGNRSLDYIFDPDIESAEHLKQTVIFSASNLSEAEARKNPKYLKLVLMAIYFKAKIWFDQNIDIPDDARPRVFAKMQIGLQTRSSLIEHQALSLIPDDKFSRQWNFQRSDQADLTVENQLPRLLKSGADQLRTGEVNIVSFQTDKVFQWITQDPELAEIAKKFLKSANYRLLQLRNDLLGL